MTDVQIKATAVEEIKVKCAFSENTLTITDWGKTKLFFQSYSPGDPTSSDDDETNDVSIGIAITIDDAEILANNILQMVAQKRQKG